LNNPARWRSIESLPGDGKLGMTRDEKASSKKRAVGWEGHTTTPKEQKRSPRREDPYRGRGWTPLPPWAKGGKKK